MMYSYRTVGWTVLSVRLGLCLLEAFVCSFHLFSSSVSFETGDVDQETQQEFHNNIFIIPHHLVVEGSQWGAGDNSVVQHADQSLVKKQSTQYLIGVNLMATGCSGLLTLSKRLHVSHSPVISNWNPARLVVDEVSTVYSKPGWLYLQLRLVITLPMLSW